MKAINTTADEVELGTDRYGEGYIELKEFYFGQHEDLETQHYC
jgi:hypothetical protein